MAKNNNQWINRMEIRSETSKRIYVVAQHAIKWHWGCSCPGWRRHRRCKHLQQLGLPGDEQPFEVKKESAKKKGFLDGYKTYDAGAGHGSPEQWQKAFAEKMGLDEARQVLELPADAGWDDVRRVLHLAATESTGRLLGDYDTAVRRFGQEGPVEPQAQAIRTAKFRIEAYAAYLEEQRRKLEKEAERVTVQLLTKIETM